MRILRIIASIDPKGGGPIEALRLTAANLEELGHQTELVTLDDPKSDEISAFPYTVHACGPGTKKYGYTRKLSRWIAEHGGEYDVAIVEGLWNHASVGGWQGLRKAGLPYVVFTHGMMDPWFKKAYPLKHLAKQAFWLGWQGKVLRDAKAVLFTCEEERRLARGSFWGFDYNERVVAFGSAEPPNDAETQKAAFSEALPQVSGKRFLLYLSRIHRKKGCDLLIEAFSKYAKSNPDIELVIAGPDQENWRQELETIADAEGIAQRIHWPGMISGDQKWGAFRSAEAFILPSHQENFGIVVAEAMACGTPVLTTNKVNIWREVEASGGGLIEDDTVQGIEHLLGRWLQLGDEEKVEMGRNARAGFDKYFQAEAAAKDLAQALHDACDDS